MSDDIVTRLNTEEMTKAFYKAFPTVVTLEDAMRQALKAADEIERLRADRDRWVEIAQLWDGAYSAQTYIHGLDEIETADMARKAQAKAVRGE